MSRQGSRSIASVRERFGPAIVIAYLLFMSAALLVPSDVLPNWLRGQEDVLGNLGPKDKVLHVLSFAALAWIAVWGSGQSSSLLLFLGVFLGSLAYAVLTELIQGATGWREADLTDLAADLAGTVLGLVTALVTFPPRPRRIVPVRPLKQKSR